MAKLGIKIVDVDGKVKASCEDKLEVALAYQGVYKEGDTIVFVNSEPERLYVISVDQSVGAALVYVTKEEIEYHIPFGDKKMCYCPQAFEGESHLITAREAYPWEVSRYRNMAENVMDQHSSSGCYPHAFANAETLGESAYAARNAIDGCTANQSHGRWPYAAWGVNCRDDAEIVVNFGREVWIDRIILHTSADSSDDNWWSKAVAEFSDDTQVELELHNTHHGQEILLPERKHVSWIKLKELVRANELSGYPSLTQLAVYGGDICD